MEKQERYYKISKLNFLFATGSILLLAALVGLFIHDYKREWKKYQQEFRKLEAEKTRALLSQDESRLKVDPAYQEILKNIEAAKTQVKSKSHEVGALQGQLEKLQAKYDLNQQSYQFAKAQFDSSKYAYEDAKARRLPGAPAKEKALNALSQKLESLRLAVEQSKSALDEQNTKIQSYSLELRKLEKEKGALAKQAEIYERKLKKIDPQSMSAANKIAESLRNLPVLDLMNPSNHIEQVVLKDITDDVNFMRVPKVDRCITCHIGVLKPGFENAPQPFRTHPNLELFLSSNSPHPMEEFGCTVCHGGRGRGTDFVSTAHMPSTLQQREEWEKKYKWHEFHYWETPMYPLKYVEAGCFKCHEGQTVIKGAEKLNLGLNLIEKSGCYGCHLIEKYKDWPRVGPDLTHLAAKTTQDWAYRWIKDPKSFRHNTWMPSFFNQSNTSDEVSQKRTDQEIHAIVHYLFKNSVDFKSDGLPKGGDVKKGEELVASLGCFGCHDIKPQKTPRGVVTRQALHREHGPNLVGLGTKTTPQWLYNWLKDPNRYHPGTRMPNLRLSDSEAADVAMFLSAGDDAVFMKTAVLPVDENILNAIVRDFLVKMTTVADANKQLDTMSADEKLSFAGKKLIKHYGCFACHIIPGFADEKPIGTELTEEGSKSAHRLDFGFVDIDHTNYSWFTEKLKNPRIFDQNRVRAADEKLKMPNFNFTDQEIEAIVTALLGFTKDKPAASRMVPRTPEHLFVERGERFVREFNCQGCHIMENEGGAIQPAVTDWLMKFEGRAENDAKAVTTSFSPPNLTGEGEKVQAEWLFNFIHQPQVIRPWLKVRMPTFSSLSTEEINTFVKYFSYLDKQDFPFTGTFENTMTPAEIEASHKLFSKDYFDCTKCHIVGAKLPAGSQESWAPDFALAKKRLKPEWIIKWIKNPQGLLPGTKMPTFFDPKYFESSGPDDILGGDENKQIKVMRDYLMTISDEPLPLENKAVAPIQEPPVSQPVPQAQPAAVESKPQTENSVPKPLP